MSGRFDDKVAFVTGAGGISDSTAAVLWLLSTEARMITGLEMTVDTGGTKK